MPKVEKNTDIIFMIFVFSGAAGKKNRQKERRLMKGFKVTGAQGAGTVNAADRFITLAN
jgi:hypothetical protein